MFASGSAESNVNSAIELLENVAAASSNAARSLDCPSIYDALRRNAKAYLSGHDRESLKSGAKNEPFQMF
jgi:hypothetical protein